MLTVEQRIKRHIMRTGDGPEILADANMVCDFEDGESIDHVYDELQSEWLLQDGLEDFRCSGVETGLPCEYSRHYESESVAKQLDDGSWVGWTYWYGGGKFGDPQAIDWLEEAYDLDVIETQEMVTVRKFSKR